MQGGRKKKRKAEVEDKMEGNRKREVTKNKNKSQNEENNDENVTERSRMVTKRTIGMKKYLGGRKKWKMSKKSEERKLDKGEKCEAHVSNNKPINWMANSCYTSRLLKLKICNSTFSSLFFYLFVLKRNQPFLSLLQNSPPCTASSYAKGEGVKC